MSASQTPKQAQTELLRRVARREHEALAQLYDQIARPLFSMAVHILGDSREAEEVIQDVFVQIWNRAGTFDGELGAPFSWTVGITRNRCIDYLRARQRRSRLIDEAILETEVHSSKGEPDGREGLSVEELATVRASVNELPADQKRAIELAFFGGMSHAEIADLLGEPLGTVKARIRRGMLRLKESLKAYV